MNLTPLELVLVCCCPKSYPDLSELKCLELRIKSLLTLRVLGTFTLAHLYITIKD